MPELNFLPPADLCRFYRMVDRPDKTAWTRCLAYLFLGYAAAARFELLPMLVNTVIVAGIFMSAFALNDHYDHQVLKEKNFAGDLIASGAVSRRRALAMACLPLLSCVLLPFMPGRGPVLLLGAFLFVSLAHSLPALRLKESAGWATSPVCAVLIFLEGALLLGGLNRNILFLAALVLGLHLYLEMLHILDDLGRGESSSISDKALSFRILKTVPVAMLLLSAAFSFFNICFLAGVVFSIRRLLALRRSGPDSDFNALRRRIFAPLFSSHEFAFYGFAGIFGWFIRP